MGLEPSHQPVNRFDEVLRLKVELDGVCLELELAESSSQWVQKCRLDIFQIPNPLRLPLESWQPEVPFA